jgi:hypothetical protein
MVLQRFGVLGLLQRYSRMVDVLDHAGHEMMRTASAAAALER